MFSPLPVHRGPLVHLDNNDERLIIPIKQRSIYAPTVKLFQHPALLNGIHSDKFPATEQLSKLNKKHWKHHIIPEELLVHHQPAANGAAIIATTKFNLKKCCRGNNEWRSTEDVVPNKQQEVVHNFDELFQPVSLLLGPADAQIHGYGNVVVEDDIKPVTEHIPDDLKYDFRTKTHTF